MTARVTNWFNRIVNWTLPKIGFVKKNTAPVSQEERLTRSLGRYEPYVFQIQSILIWENPLISALSLLAVNFIFWFVVNYECRLYGVIFSTCLMFYTYEMWTEHIWPEISIPTPVKPEAEQWTPQHPSGVLSVPEISGYVVEIGKLVKSYFIYLRNLRTEQPSIFCCEMCGVFGALFFIGRSVSAVTVGYCLLMSVMVGPGVCIHVLPPSAVDRMANALASFRAHKTRESDSEGEDMLPEATHENLSLLHRAGEMDISSEREDTNEFAFDPALSDLTASLPESSLDDLEDLEPPACRRRHSGSPPSDSDDSGGDGIHFRSSHFNGTSSSSEEGEEGFTRGLAFVDSPAATLPDQCRDEAYTGPTLMSGLAQNLTTLGTSLISSVMSRAAASAPPRRPRPPSSDSEEFEIIDSEDVS